MADIQQFCGAQVPAVLTKAEAADFLRCTPRYIERQVRLGRLKAVKPSGRLWRVRRSDLEAFLESGATIGGGE
jgi:excisionase family DNA binding protein